MAFTNLFAKTDFELVGSGGAIKARGKAQFDSAKVFIYDTSLQIFTGDEIRRRLPNGADEAFEVVDPVFYDGFGAIPAHYEVVVRRKGTFPHHSGGHFSITVSGENARVNVNSTDSSTNTVNNSEIFSRMIQAVEEDVPDVDQKQAIVAAIHEMEQHRNTSAFAIAYQKVLALTADHIGVISPFLPALAAYFAS